MKSLANPFADISDGELLAAVEQFAAAERRATVPLIQALMELDSRRLYLGQGFSSLFSFCTEALHLSEHAAYNRIEVARAARRVPRLLVALRDGDINLTVARLLAPHITARNCREMLARARHKGSRDIEALVAAVLRRPERHYLQLTVSKEAFEKLQQVRNLMRHITPHGDLAVIFDRAISLLLAQLERTRLAAVKVPRISRGKKSRSRHIPAAVKRSVWKRDGGRCAFMGTRGRCPERALLEWHHVVPFAAGGPATTENIELRCRAHNQYEADRVDGVR